MNEEQLIDNLLTFYLAGHETTAKALTWTLYLLARSPEWTAVLKEEIARVTGGGAGGGRAHRQARADPAGRQGKHAPVSAGAGHEPAGGGGHDAGGARHQGRHLGRHPDLCPAPPRARWTNPEMFDPTRFAPEHEAEISRYQYMPFGAGPRICIGMAFAMIEATAMLATMLQSARFGLAADRDADAHRAGHAGAQGRHAAARFGLD